MLDKIVGDTFCSGALYVVVSPLTCITTNTLSVVLELGPVFFLNAGGNNNRICPCIYCC